jgi:ribosomal protein S18 acetylase RimI-like enzyme
MIEFRQADVRDATFLVPLIAEASGGVWPAMWKALAYEGETVEQSGARYLADLSNKLSIVNTVVAELDGVRVGMMSRYQEERRVSGARDSGSQVALPADLTSALKPYRELSDADSFFVAELCCLEEARGKGLGSRLLDQAKREAVSLGLPRVTLRVFSKNTGAIRLYERSGFHTVEQRVVIAHPDIAVGGSVLLMSCAL